MGLKTHCKVALVVRTEGNETRRYVHIASGNYNSKTARNYEDFGLLTDDAVITKDVGELFNYLTGFAKIGNYERIVVSPFGIREFLISEIERQRDLGSAGRILIKTNGLTDPSVIDALYDASMAGVEVRLLVRTLCCLRPGVEGLSENISVHSLVGQFLEHSRLFIFGHPGEDRDRVYMGSADVMERNLDRRVEVIVPVDDPALRAELLDAFEVTWRDDESTWVLGSDRRWRRRQPVTAFSAQDEFKRRALAKNRLL
jgi:polyphosphate kinase